MAVAGMKDIKRRNKSDETTIQITKAKKGNELPGDLAIEHLERICDRGRKGCTSICRGHVCLLAVTYCYGCSRDQCFGRLM